MEKMIGRQSALRDGFGRRQKSAGGTGKIAEYCWLAIALVLFMIMGPFAAPVALFAVLGLPSEERGEAEPEMLSEPVRYQLR
jgi:hypothetical protein